MTNFLPKDPTLNKKDQEVVFKFNEQPYNELYSNALEGQLFEGVKVKRKESSMPKLKFDKLNVDSYGELAINKYGVDSPVAGATSGAGRVVTGEGALAQPSSPDLSMPTPTFKSFVERQQEQIQNFPTTLKEVGETIGQDVKKVGAGLASGVAGVLDIGQQQYAKAGAGTTTIIGGLKNFGDEIIKSLPTPQQFVALGSDPFREEEDKVINQLEKPDFMSAAEKTEELKQQAEWFFGTRLEFGDYLDIRSTSEKRKEVFNEMPTHLQEGMKPLENWAIGYDVISGIASGIGATKAPITLADKVGRGTTLGKSMVALDKGMSKVVDQIPKLGVAFGAAATGYYLNTGEWMFKDDSAATEGAAIFMSAAGLKGLGHLTTKGWELTSGGRKYLKDMLADPDFQKGVKTYLEEAKNTFGEQIDVIATKAGVKANLLPDSKIVDEAEEIIAARTSKELEEKAAQNAAEGIDLLKNASDTITRDRGGFYNKAVADGIIDEGDSMYKAISRRAKLALSPERKVDEVAGMMLGDTGIKFKKNFSFKDSILGNFLDPAKREIRDSLEGTRVFGKIQNFNNVLDEARGKVNDLSDFNAYLFAKSRFFKVKDKQGDIATNIITTKPNGNKEVVNMTKEQLRDVYLAGEKKYGAIADDIHKQYQSLLQYERSLGIRSEDDLVNFAKNPYWMPDKTLDTGAAFKEGISKLSIKTPKAFLGQGQEIIDNNTLLNAYGDMSYRYEIANRIDKLNKARDLGMDVVKPLKEGAKPEKGFVEIKLYENGERVSFQGRKFFVEDVLRDDKLSTNIFLRAASLPTRIIKSATTGILNPVYQATAPYYEMSAALIKNWANGGKASDFLATALAGSNSKVTDKFTRGLNKIPGVDMTKAIENAAGGDFFATPSMKKSFIEMANFLGGTFTKGSRARLELEATLGDEFTRYSAKKTAFEKGKDAAMTVRDAADIGNSIELFTTRLPMFSSELKRQGLTPKMFKEIAEDVTSPTQLIRKLEGAGFNPEKAANLSRNLYDYMIAKKTVDESGRILGYLSDIVARGPASVKRLMEDNPNFFVKGMGAGTVAGAAIYEFNTNTPEKKAAYENAPDYIRNTPYLFVGINEETGKGEFLRISKNLPMLDWTYSMYIQMRERSEEKGIDLSKAFNSIVEDTTGVVSLDKKFNLNMEILPDSVNRYVKYKTGFDLKNNYQAFKRTDLEKALPSEDYDKNTSNFAIGLSRMIAVMNGGEMQDVAGRKIVTGDTISPRLIDEMLNTFDSGLIRSQGQKLMDEFRDEGRVDRFKTNAFVKVFLKQASITDFDEEEFGKTQKARGEEQLINSIIKTQIKNEDDIDVLTARALELAQKYPRKEKAILDAIKNKVKEESFKQAGGDQDLFHLSKNSNAVIARRLIAEMDEGKTAKQMLDKLGLMVEQGLISETKGRNILNTLTELVQEKAK